MASSDSTPFIPVVDPAATCFEEMYRQDPSLRPDGLMGGINHYRVLSAVPLRTSVTVASSSQASRPKGKKSKTVKNQKTVEGQIRKSSPVTVLETGQITSTGCLLLDIDFDEALRFVGEGYSVHGPHATNHVFSVTSPDAEAEAVLGSRPKHGLEESTSRPEDSEIEEREEEEDEEIETDEESGQPSYSKDVANVEPSGDMHPLEVVRRAKLLAQIQGREEEVHREPPSGNTSGPAATIPDREVVQTWSQRKRKLLQTEEEETASKQDVILTQSLLAKRPVVPQDGKCPASLDISDGNAQAEAEVASLSVALKDEDEILSSLQGLVDGFHKKWSLEAERDRALAEREQAVSEKERAVSDFLQSPAF
ncbi:unnamed protein product [Cuscuta campestris]|uniref:Uncharacterized protein n=1 Tax=Cuscuta campestris TaxID=132261 RepID=A0A484MBT5_9ASTE|nr:unnamed protein product [Cuscuta campestris]